MVQSSNLKKCNRLKLKFQKKLNRRLLKCNKTVKKRIKIIINKNLKMKLREKLQ